MAEDSYEGSEQAPGIAEGGRAIPKPLDYRPPVGPSNINDPKTPGIHGSNHGNSGTQHK